MRTMSTAARRLVAAIATLAAMACGGYDNPIGPSNQPEIGNAPDNFQFQASNLSGTTQTLTYTWSNSAPTANVDQSGSISGGDAVLVLRDASGTQVYSGDLTNTGTFVTSNGTAGSWRIEVRLTNVRGTINFRVQKRS